jgi:ferric-dicitrate binding protein FerR (iron transport regulator)
MKHAGGSWVEAENGMDLVESDTVKTGDDSSASIILFKSSIVRLDSNTEVTIKELVQGDENSVTLEQNAGRTWNTVQKISGIDSYEVQTPTTVASVRSTAFDVNVSEEGITIVSVVKGIVNVSYTSEGVTYSVDVGKNYSVTVSYDALGQPQEFDPDDWIQNNLLKDESFKENLKTELKEKIEPYLDELRERVDIPDEHIDVLIDEYMEGNFEIPPETPDYLKELFDLS